MFCLRFVDLFDYCLKLVTYVAVVVFGIEFCGFVLTLCVVTVWCLCYLIIVLLQWIEFLLFVAWCFGLVGGFIVEFCGCLFVCVFGL